VRKPASKLKETILLITSSDLELRIEKNWKRCPRILKNLTTLHVWFAIQGIQKECGRSHRGFQ
jgi:hypothetical protein